MIQAAELNRADLEDVLVGAVRSTRRDLYAVLFLALVLVVMLLAALIHFMFGYADNWPLFNGGLLIVLVMGFPLVGIHDAFTRLALRFPPPIDIVLIPRLRG